MIGVSLNDYSNSFIFSSIVSLKPLNPVFTNSFLSFSVLYLPFNLALDLCDYSIFSSQLLFALFALPAIVLAASPARNPFEVEGLVFCDTCRCGFETSKTTYIAGARVRVECKNRQTMELVYSKEATTDSTGTYKLYVNEDHQDQLCDAMVVSSPQSGCSRPASGRDKARVILTGYNGIATNKRFANAMGFEADEPMSGCTELLRQYQEYEE